MFIHSYPIRIYIIYIIYNIYNIYNIYIQLLNFRLCESYSKILIVHADHVGSRQLAEIRLSLRGTGIVLMGKNTMIRTALHKMTAQMPQLEKLIPLIKQNIGLVYCIDDAAAVRKVVLDNRVPAPARQGVFAPCDVVIPAGPTGLDPSQTSFFQALGISTKIVKGQIEIQTDVNLITQGEKVTASQSALLQKLNIRPFSYGLVVRQIYDDGSVYDASVLDITNQDIITKFTSGVQNVAALSREVGLPNQVSVVHSLMEAFKFCTAAILDTAYTFPEMEKIKEILENPEAFAAIMTATTAVPSAGGAPAAAAPAAVEEEEEEEDDMGFGLFD